MYRHLPAFGESLGRLTMLHAATGGLSRRFLHGTRRRFPEGCLLTDEHQSRHGHFLCQVSCHHRRDNQHRPSRHAPTRGIPLIPILFPAAPTEPRRRLSRSRLEVPISFFHHHQDFLRAGRCRYDRRCSLNRLRRLGLTGAGPEPEPESQGGQ